MNNKVKNFGEYTQGVLRTESAHNPLTDTVRDNNLSHRLLHAIIGVATEVNEIYDAIEVDGPYDEVNVLEECGDLFWYLAVGFEAASEITGSYYTYDIPAGIPEGSSALDLLSQIRRYSSELLDLAKKTMFYNKPLDTENVLTLLGFTLGRVFALVNYISDAPDSDISTAPLKVMNTNLEKLKARYPEKFTEADAENRDLAKERDILEGGII